MPYIDEKTGEAFYFGSGIVKARREIRENRRYLRIFTTIFLTLFTITFTFLINKVNADKKQFVVKTKIELSDSKRAELFQKVFEKTKEIIYKNFDMSVNLDGSRYGYISYRSVDNSFYEVHFSANDYYKYLSIIHIQKGNTYLLIDIKADGILDDIYPNNYTKTARSDIFAKKFQNEYKQKLKKEYEKFDIFLLSFEKEYLNN